MLNLFLNDYKPICTFAQDWKKLSFKTECGARVGLKDFKYIHPKIISEKLKIPYINISHDDCSEIVKEKNLDVGIILGSRILKKEVVESFNIGVINMHPGLLPENRGLDNIKWAIIDNLPQGVTTHFISEEIDKGFLINRKIVNVYLDDTFTEIMARIQNKEQVMMIEALNKISISKGFIKLQDGKYNHVVDSDMDKLSQEKFYGYKKNYDNIVNNYLTTNEFK